MKEKLFWIGIVFVVLSWAGNYLYFQSQQLDQPVFLDHYYETYLQDEAYLRFYYLANKDDGSEVSYVLIDGVELYPDSNEGFFMWDSGAPVFEQEFSHQYLKSVRLKFEEPLIPIEKGTNHLWSFEKIDVVFSNGERVTADIGKVKVYEKRPERIFETRHSSSSTNHISEESMIALKPLTVEAITIPFSEDLFDDIFIKVDLNQERLKALDVVKDGGNPPRWIEDRRDTTWEDLDGIPITEDIFPFHLEQNEWILLSMLFNPNRKSYFEFGISIKGTTDDGEPFTYETPIIDHPYLTDYDIKEIITEKQGGSNQ